MSNEVKQEAPERIWIGGGHGYLLREEGNCLCYSDSQIGGTEYVRVDLLATVRREAFKEAAAMIHNLSVPNGFEQAFGYATGLGRAEKVLLEAANQKGEVNGN